MICDICNCKQASVHVTEIINNKMTELHLCEDCAKKKSFQMEQHFGLADLLAGLSDFGVSIDKGTKKQGLKCSNCGLSYEDFRKVGRFGCSECYSTFKNNLAPLLKRIHRSTRHTGSSPSAKKKASKKPVAVAKPKPKVKESKLDVLKGQMQEAVDKEAFEEAAKLRDKINKLKSKEK